MNIIKPSALLITDSDPLSIVEDAARNCYKSPKSKTPKRRDKFLRKIILQNGHKSIAEHVGAGLMMLESSSTILNYIGHVPELARGLQILKLDYDEVTILSGNIRMWMELIDALGVYHSSDISHALSPLYPELIESAKYPKDNNKLITPFKTNLAATKEFKDTLIMVDGFKLNGDLDIEKHTLVTFKITGSRSMTHQLARHRRPVYSQESQRYINYTKKGAGVDFILPESLNDVMKDRVGRIVTDLERYYNELDVAPEDKRCILPNATASTVYMTTTISDWRHIIKARTDPHAQEEIRSIFKLIEKQLDNLLSSVLY